MLATKYKSNKTEFKEIQLDHVLPVSTAPLVLLKINVVPWSQSIFKSHESGLSAVFFFAWHIFLDQTAARWLVLSPHN